MTKGNLYCSLDFDQVETLIKALENYNPTKINEKCLKYDLINFLHCQMEKAKNEVQQIGKG